MSKLTLEEVKLTLTKDLPCINKSYPFINNGGCGFMADCLAEQVIELGFKVSIVIFSDGEGSEDAINSSINNSSLVKGVITLSS